MTLATHRNRRLFKIAAVARFCERQVRTTCAARGWTVEAVRIRADGVQLLVQVPAELGRGALASQLKDDLTGALRQGRVIPRIQKAFGSGHWCSVVTNAAGLQALRRHLGKA